MKSGTDFRQFSKININFAGDCARVDIAEVAVTSSFVEDPVLKGKVEKYSGNAIKPKTTLYFTYKLYLRGLTDFDKYYVGVSVTKFAKYNYLNAGLT